MFDTNSIAVAIHVLFAGLWIGADLGTFLSYRRVIDPTLEVGTRRAMARYFALIDMGPRTALIVMLGLGLYLAYDRGYGFTSGAWQVAAWIMIIASFLWLALVWYLHWAGEPERSAAHARPLSVLTRSTSAGAASLPCSSSLRGSAPSPRRILPCWTSSAGRC